MHSVIFAHGTSDNSRLMQFPVFRCRLIINDRWKCTREAVSTKGQRARTIMQEKPRERLNCVKLLINYWFLPVRSDIRRVDYTRRVSGRSHSNLKIDSSKPGHGCVWTKTCVGSRVHFRVVWTKTLDSFKWFFSREIRAVLLKLLKGVLQEYSAGDAITKTVCSATPF